MIEHDPVILELMKKLPPAGSDWPVDKRSLWLKAMESVLDLVYGPVEKIDITFVPAAHSMSSFVADLTQKVAAAVPFVEAQSPPALIPAAEPEKPKAEKPAPALPAKRPAGIPENLDMAIEAIKSLGGSASATQIRSYARSKWWPAMSDQWSNCLYAFVDSGRLARDGINFTLPPVKAEPPLARAMRERESVPQKVPAQAGPLQTRISSPGVKLGPPANPANGHAFEWKGETVKLHEKEFKMLQRMKPVIGKGFLSFGDIAGAAFAPARCPGDSYAWCRDMVPIINPKIERLGLELKLVEKMGYALRELT